MNVRFLPSIDRASKVAYGLATVVSLWLSFPNAFSYLRGPRYVSRPLFPIVSSAHPENRVTLAPAQR